ncbi:MAG: TetR/AcrR family transcriptional regulator [Planctomycetes bacterium]|nr:TetR/AcrR family transcriptional regulator [Planctomycetota bacterium]
MARPANTDSSETRARILQAATTCFSASGSSGASTRQIAKAAGVSLATLHHHFQGKEGLYSACVDAMYEEFGGIRAELMAAVGETPGARIRDAVRRSFLFACAHREAIRLTTIDAIERGQTEAKTRVDLLLPAIEEGAAALAAFSGRDEVGLRLALRSVSYLVVRYALTDASELALILGLEEQAAEDLVLERIAEHLGDLALGALGLDEGEPS